MFCKEINFCLFFILDDLQKSFSPFAKISIRFWKLLKLSCNIIKEYGYIGFLIVIARSNRSKTELFSRVQPIEIPWLDLVSNEEFRQRTCQLNILRTIVQSRVRWLGHVLRRPAGLPAKSYLQIQPAIYRLETISQQTMRPLEGHRPLRQILQQIKI